MAEAAQRTPEPTGSRSAGLLLYLLLAVAALTSIAMRQISGMLGRVEAGGLSNTMSVLTSPNLRVDPIREAGTAWRQRAAEVFDEDVQDVAAALISWHTRIDFLFLAAYAVLLGWLLVRLTTDPDASTGLGGRLADSRRTAPVAWGLLLLLGVTDITENLLTLDFAARIAALEDPRPLAGWLMGVTLVKWVALGLLLLDVVVLFLKHAEARAGLDSDDRRGAMTRLGDVARERDRERRIWRRHRVQIGAVLVLGVLVALPAGGPLDQIPDILRTYADGPGIRWAEYAWSVLTLGTLCLALWIAGRWAVLGAAGKKLWPEPRPRYVFLAALGSAVLAAALFFGEPGDLRFNGGVFALPLVLALLWLLWWPVSDDRFAGPKWLWRRIRRRPRAEPAATGTAAPQDTVHVPRIDDRVAVRRAGRLLAALPIAIAGLGLVRAFVDPLVTGSLSGGEELESRILLGLAVAAVLVAAPLFYALLAGVERLLGDDSRGQNAIGVLVLVVAVVLAVRTAADPVTWGPKLNATGSVSVVLALVVLGGGALQWLSERQAPYRPLTRLRLADRTPFLALLAVAFVVAGLLNVQGGYHALRVVEAEGTADPLQLRTTFRHWLAVVDRSACTVEGSYATEGRPAVPLVILAAPGGGIRAAYWTDHALHELGKNHTCDDTAVFAASGVSGGSVGLMAHYLPVDDALEDGALVEDMSRERALAASVAAMAFRDLPAAVLGVSAGWRDRGAVLEDAWAESDDAWTDTRLIGDLVPEETDARWRPLLLLNGTEVSTGCRLVVSPRQVVASGPRGAPRSCRNAAVGAEGHGVVEGAVDLHWFRDEQTCGEPETIDDGDLRASSAALLSARFPYVSPSAELFRCQGRQAQRAADLDGGAAENSGLATALDLWDALEPVVTQHNAEVQRCSRDDEAEGCSELPAQQVVVPMLVLVDNHYASSTAPRPVSRQRELSAPAGLLSADGVLATQSVLEQEALVTFSGPVPGLEGDSPLRYFRVAPVVRPGLAAPLGWTLSDLTRTDLDEQLADAMDVACEQIESGLLHPAAASCYLQAVGGTPRGG